MNIAKCLRTTAFNQTTPAAPSVRVSFLTRTSLEFIFWRKNIETLFVLHNKLNGNKGLFP